MAPRPIPIPVGKMFGKLKVTSPRPTYTHDSRRRRTRWRVRCECGATFAVIPSNLKKQTSCRKCVKRAGWSAGNSGGNYAWPPSRPRTHTPGKVWGRVTLLEKLDTKSLWRVRCSCGAEYSTNVCQFPAKHRRSRGKHPACNSCGHQQLDAPMKSRPREYNAWHSMKHRCYNPKTAHYKNYGGRGIRICLRWQKSFAAFLADMGPRPAGTSIDRTDNDGNYTPKNCRWATTKEQARNTRRNVWITVNSERLTLSDWAHHLGVSRQMIDARIRAGWTHKAAITTPKKPRAAR